MSEVNQVFDVRQFLLKLMGNWPWFVASLLISISIAFILIEISDPKYPVKGRLLIGLEGKSPSRTLMKEQGAFDLNISIENELEILRSVSVMRRLVDSLQLNVKYGTDATNSILKRPNHFSRFSVKEVSFQDTFTPTEFDLKELDIDSFELQYVVDGRGVNRTYRYGEMIAGPGINFIIEKALNDSETMELDNFLFTISDPTVVARNLVDNLTIRSVSPKSTIVEIGLETSDPIVGEQVINGLMNFYIGRELLLKDEKADKVIALINEQLKTVYSELKAIEEELEGFRTRNQILNVSQEAAETYNRLRGLEREMAQLIVQSEYFTYLLDYLSNPVPGAIVSPSTAGITDQALNGLVLRLNNLSSDLIQLETSASSANPLLKTLKDQFTSNLSAIRENVRSAYNSNQLQQQSLSGRIRQVEMEIEALPRNEMLLLGLERKFSLSEGLYTYLLQQKAQAEIARAGNETSSEIIDPASTYPRSFPKPSINLSFSVVAGLLLPIIFLGIKDFFNDRIMSAADIRQLTDTPIVGSLPKIGTQSNTSGVTGVSDATEDFFRRIVVGMKAVLNKITGSRVVMISSFHNGEGKTLVASHIAHALARLGHKTLVIFWDVVDFDLLPVAISKTNLPDSISDGEISTTPVTNLDFLLGGRNAAKDAFA
ncbi:MAG: GNVR domain-containing protein, partial [Imperialibacter sp.]